MYLMLNNVIAYEITRIHENGRKSSIMSCDTFLCNSFPNLHDYSLFDFTVLYLNIYVILVHNMILKF